MNKRLVGSVIAVVAVVALAGVAVTAMKDDDKNKTADSTGSSSSNSSSHDESMSNMSSDDNNSGSSSDTTDAVETDKVAIKDFAFSPATIKVKKGTTVTWTNNDSIGHTVTGLNGGPDSELLDNGESYTFTFNETGTFEYKCTPHPQMKGEVVVTE
jgi:plastocyanin